MLDNIKHRCYNTYIKQRDNKGDKTMKKYNLWKSTYTNEIYKMPINWMPQFDGWELIGTVEE